MGSPFEVKVVLLELLELSRLGIIDLVGVVTPPPKKAGRGKEPSEVHLATEARSLGCQVLQPEKCSSPDFISWLKSQNIDVVLTAAYGQILSRDFLEAPKRAVINIHPSLLPKYRGPTPVPASLLAGEHETGVTVLFTTFEIDAGNIIASESITLSGQERAGALTQELFSLGAGLLGHVFKKLADPSFEGDEQDSAAMSRCRKIKKTDAAIDWSESAKSIFARARAFDPWPGSYTGLAKKRVQLEISGLEINFADKELEAACFVLSNDRELIIVGTGSGFLKIKALKVEGKGWVSPLAFWNSAKAGDCCFLTPKDLGQKP